MAVFAGLAANTLLGAWWLDGVVALGIAGWAVAEGRRAWVGFVAHLVLDHGARPAALLGDADGAAIAYTRLLPWAGYFVAGGTALVAISGSAEHTLGCLAACLGKPDTAVRHLRAAVAANQRAGLPPSELQSRYELAKVLARRSRGEDRSEALVLAGDAARGTARLGMRGLQADAGHLAETLRSSSTGSGGLTRRECEIAELVGHGLTNRQIADLLHIAERTAENHVQHILTKLGFRNRSQIAAWPPEQLLPALALHWHVTGKPDHTTGHGPTTRTTIVAAV